MTTTDHPAVSLAMVTIDCADAGAAAQFWSGLLGWEIVASGEGYAMLSGAGHTVGFGSVPDYRPPAWPSAENPQQLHLDLNVTDLEAAHERVLGLGAKLLDDAPKTFRVYADPVGHPFCLCAC